MHSCQAELNVKFGLKFHLCSDFLSVSSEGSGRTVLNLQACLNLHRPCVQHVQDSYVLAPVMWVSLEGALVNLRMPKEAMIIVQTSVHVFILCILLLKFVII